MEPFAEIREIILDRDRLRRAVAAGRRRGSHPSAVRVELRPVDLKAGPRLQVVTSDGIRPSTANVEWGPAAESIVDKLLAEPFGSWHVDAATETIQVRITKRGEARVHRSAPTSVPLRPHDREPEHLLDPGDPLFATIGGSAAKRRQVDAFLRALSTFTLAGKLKVVDLGCGNAYLTFAAFHYLTRIGVDVTLVGVDIRDDQRARNTALAAELGWSSRVSFLAGSIVDAPIDGADVVLALHACDTATDEALARAIRWQAPYVLAAPCCHHDIAAQLRRSDTALTRYGILRERFADVLTDALRAALLRQNGYRVDVVEFIDSAHTPRNVLLRARYTGAQPTVDPEYRALTAEWGVTPALERLLA